MMMRLVAVAAFCSLFFFVRNAAEANGIASSILQQAGAPVEILSCSANVQFFNNVYGTYFSNLNTQADFRNASDKTAVAVLIHFRLASVFGNVMGNIFGPATGQFSSGTPIKGNHWAETDTWPGLGEIKCSVARVLFSDGSEWLEPKSLPENSTTPIATSSS